MTSGPASSTAPRVLIVDDDVSVTDTFSRMLRLEGYEVWSALSADEGLQLAQAHHPQAIILDLRMPLTSGLQFLRDIRNVPALIEINKIENADRVPVGTQLLLPPSNGFVPIGATTTMPP